MGLCQTGTWVGFSSINRFPSPWGAATTRDPEYQYDHENRKQRDAAVPEHPEVAGRALHLDLLALDSEYDYDPFWAKCIELKVAVTTHSTGQGWGSRRSISNYMFNHIGHFGAAGEAMCKALFFGGVTRRFPTLKFAFLDGGVSWACNLFSDLIEHWKKRNAKTIGNLDPASMDRERFKRLIDAYGEEKMKGMSPEIMQALARAQRRPSVLDDCPKSGPGNRRLICSLGAS